MKTRRLAQIVISVVLAMTAADSLANDEKPADTKLPARVREALWWLPEDTQMLIVAQGPFRTRIHGPKDGLKGLSLERSVQLLTSGAILATSHGVHAESFRDRNIALAMTGERRFRRPTGLGWTLSEGAEIVVFQDDLGEVGKTWMGDVKKGATRIETIAGIEVAMHQEKWERDIGTVYFTHPRPNVLIVATDRGYLQTVLERMAKRAAKRAFPPTLPEWKHLDVIAMVWAIRHYDPKQAAEDPSSPIGEGNAFDVRDDQAVGFVFWLEPRDGTLVQVRYLSTNTDSSRVAGRLFGLEAFTDSGKWVTREADGVIGISIPSKNLAADQIEDFVNWLLRALGHIAYL